MSNSNGKNDPSSETTPLVQRRGDETSATAPITTFPWLQVLLFAVAMFGVFFLGTLVEWRSNQYISIPLPAISDNDDDRKYPVDQKYIATQFISFTINTLGGLAEHGECDGRPVDPYGVCYMGNVNNITEDILHRAEIVKKVLYRIKQDSFAESPDIDHSDNVLKIVAMPEFFWRGPNGAYSNKQVFEDGALIHVSNELRDYVADDFFNDFLFVFGTVITAESRDNSLEPWENALSQAEDVEYLNFAVIATGGSARDHYWVATKEYISTADFLSRTTLPNPSEEKIRDYAELDDQWKAFLMDRNSTLVTDNVIELDGLRIGIEICLDHRVGTLWNKLRTEHQDLVDVLVITSAGMAIERGPNPVVPGGVVYLSDGGASSAACMRSDSHVTFHPNVVCRGNVGGLKHIPIGGPGYSSFFDLTACWDIEDIELLKGYYSMYQTQGCAYSLKTYDIDVMDEFKYYPPSVEIYPTVDLPRSNK